MASGGPRSALEGTGAGLARCTTCFAQIFSALSSRDSAVQCGRVLYISVQCRVVQYSTIQCGALQYSAVQCGAVQCSVITPQFL